MKILIGFLLTFSWQITSGQKILQPELNSFQGQFIHYPLTVPGADISTTNLLFDKKGFLWTGTFDGLFRYDGNEYKTFSVDNQESTPVAGHLVTSLLEDFDGTIWIGTYGALNRLDRKTGLINQFIPDSSDFLSLNNRIRSIHQDRTGLLWLLTCEDILTFDKKTQKFARYFLDGSRTVWPEKPDQLFEDSKGRIWITSDNGLFRYFRETDKFILFASDQVNNSSLSSNKVTVVTEDPSGTLWCGTEGGGLNRIIDPENGIFERIKFDISGYADQGLRTILTMFIDKSGVIWLFGDGIFASYYPGKGIKDTYVIRPVNLMFNNSRGHSLQFKQVKQDSEGSIWFLQLQGLLFRFNPETEKLNLYPVPNWIVFDWIEDKSGSFWFGCANGNTWRLVMNSIPYQTARVPNMFNVSLVNSPRITQDRNDDIWLALSTGVFVVKDFNAGNAFNPRQIRPNEKDTVAGCIVRDSNGNFWMSQNKGKILKKDTGGTYTSYDIPGTTKVQIFNIVEDNRSDVWFQGLFNIYRLRSGSDQIEEFLIKDGGLKESILTGIFDILPDKKGNLWIATFNNGIYSCRTNNSIVSHFSTERSSELKNGDYCLRIKEDRSGKIWILFAYNGLYYFDKDKESLIHVNLKENNTGGFSFMDFFIDDLDNLYIYYNHGIILYNATSRKIKEIHKEQAPGSVCSFQLKSGQIISLRGPELVLFSKPVSFNEIVPEVYLSNLKINDIDITREIPDAGDVTDLKEISLKQSYDRIRFEFASMNFLFPQNNSYKYFLSGVDKDTLLMTGKNSVEYSNLRPGNYKFWFTGSNNDKVWNKEGKTISIQIVPPFSRSFLGFIIYGILFFLIVAVFTKRHFNKLVEDKRLLENEVHSRTIELEKKNQQIEQLDRMKTRFFTEISHEFRTPLTLIQGPIDNLLSEDGTLDKAKKSALMSIIKRNCQRLLNLVNQLLDISRIDAGKMKITLIEADLLKILRILVYEYFSAAETRNIHFEVDISDESFITFFDKDKIEKIVSNLLSNAFKYTQVNGTVSCRIEISKHINENSGQELIITIKDTGIGISKENIDKIFDRFYRVEGQSESDGGGTGIGLSLTEEFVALLHGCIEVTSEKEVGTTFIVRIPVGKEHLPLNEYVIAPTEGADSPESEIDLNAKALLVGKDPAPLDSRPQILVVEDNQDLRYFIRENLENEFYVYEASNGRAGIKTAFTKIPDLVVTDIIMPDIDGIEVCRTLKSDERTSHIPVIILTAKTGLENRLEGLSNGADAYLSKPFDIKELKIRIENLIKERIKLQNKYSQMNGIVEGDESLLTMDDRFMKRVSTIIRERINHFDFDVSVLQKELGMSRVHLYRKIKSLTGHSPGFLIHQHRMKLAARMIKEENGNLTEIAMSIGISNPSYFSRSFREFYGISPKKYANKQKYSGKVVII